VNSDVDNGNPLGDFSTAERRRCSSAGITNTAWWNRPR